MPIDYKKYPSNWKTEIRPRILARANNTCEFCGLENKTFVPSSKKGNKTYWGGLSLYEWYSTPFKMVQVVLTVAHLDHDEENHNIKDERLRALCQLCHLRYDAPEKARRRKNKKK